MDFSLEILALKHTGGIMLMSKIFLKFFVVFFIALQFYPVSAGAVDSGIFNITDYGITPNSKNDAVQAILSAASAAKKYVKKTGQTAEIYIPSGKFFISQFKLEGLDNITVHLGVDANIKAFPKSSSVNPSSPYLTIEDCNNFIFYGESGALLDGAGSSWWGGKGDRPDFVSIENCTNYEFYGFGLNNSPNHTLRLSDCKNGKIHDLTILSPQDSPSTDGIDPMSNVDGLEIYNCHISNGDDCIAINSNAGPMNNIYIHDCVLMNGHGLSIGSAVNYDITNVLVENVSIEGTQYGIRLKFAYSDKKAKLKNIKYNNITAKDLSRDAIRITTEYSSVPNSKVTLQDISINNFQCTSALRALNLTITDKKQVINPIELNNVNITDVQNKDIIKNCPIVVDGHSQ